MPRALRHQYPGAVYHVMARGDGGKKIFETDDDSKEFLYRLGQVCGSHGWRVHAWVLMGNHFHLLLETPEPSLVTGMKYLLGTFRPVLKNLFIYRFIFGFVKYSRSRGEILERGENFR